MTARRQLPQGWRSSEIAAFISAVDQARQMLREVELSPPPKPQVRGLLSLFSSEPSPEKAERKSTTEFYRRLQEAGRRTLETVQRQPFWNVLNDNPYFTGLQQRLATSIGEDQFDVHLRVLRAVALGGMISVAPPKSADKDARTSAENASRKLKRLRKRGVRLQSYSDDERMWRLLDDLIREMDGTQRKPYENDRAGVHAALSYFAAELFELIGPNEVQPAMLVDFAAFLDDFATREVQKQFAEEKREYLRRNLPARHGAVARKRGKSPKSARFRTH